MPTHRSTHDDPGSAPAAGPSASIAEDERVVALFRNRAELKKTHGELFDELDRLKARVRQHDSTAERVVSLLDALEARIDAGPDAGAKVLREQLRALGRAGQSMLSAVLAEGRASREAQERESWLAQWNRRRLADRQEAQGNLRVEEAQFYDARERLEALRRERERHLAPWKFMRRREFDRRIEAAARSVGECEGRLAAARALIERIDSENAPEFPGLSLAVRREVNLIVIAAAEELARRIASPSLVRLATAALAGEGESGGYGGPGGRKALGADVAKGFALLHRGEPLAGCAAARMESLLGSVRYGGDADSVPVPESVGSPRAARDADGVEVALPNVLLEDCWGLSGLLLR